jgi:NTE family protein
MASGALPPALPSVKIEGEYYWDGGIVSNTPLQYLLEQDEHQSSLVFQVDLFSARGTLPRSMSEVLTRHKEIMYSSRTRQNTDAFARLHNMKMRLAEALRRVPPEELRPGEKEFIATCSNGATINIVRLIYQHKKLRGPCTRL